VKNYSLLINGTVVGKSKSTLGFTGTLLWFYVPDRGRFIFSLVPREGYDFAKIAVLDDNRIEFTLNNERYEWLSSESILPTGGTWNLWVLHDTRYTPLFGSDIVVPRASPKLPKVLDKIEGALNSQGASLSLNLPGRPRETRTGPVVPQRVMVGGADSMENLLPKSP
jgi:hypothetical protein